MLFRIQKDHFQDALNKTVPIAEKKSTLPILSHLLVTTGDSKLIITATDLEVGLRIIIDCEVVEPGSVTLPARKALEIVRELPQTSVTVHLAESGRIRLDAADCSFELAGLDPTDYPVWSSFEDVERVSVPAEKLAYMIDKAVFAASGDDSRFNLNGVLFEPEGDLTRLVATDSHRLALIGDSIGLDLKSKVLVPKKGLTELRRVIENLQGDVMLGFEPKNMILGTDVFTMTVRLIEGDFPDYTKATNKKGDKTLRAQRLKMIQTIKRVAVLTSERNKGITVNIGPGRMEFVATHPDLGTAKDWIEISYEGEEFIILVNAFYLMESLGAVDTEFVTMEYEKDDSPIIVKPDPPANYFNLVMPMRR